MLTPIFSATILQTWLLNAWQNQTLLSKLVSLHWNSTLWWESLRLFFFIIISACWATYTPTQIKHISMMGQYLANQYFGQVQIYSLCSKLFLRFSHFKVYPQPRKRKKNNGKEQLHFIVVSSCLKKKASSQKMMKPTWLFSNSDLIIPVTVCPSSWLITLDVRAYHKDIFSIRTNSQQLWKFMSQ